MCTCVRPCEYLHTYNRQKQTKNQRNPKQQHHLKKLNVSIHHHAVQFLIPSFPQATSFYRECVSRMTHGRGVHVWQDMSKLSSVHVMFLAHFPELKIARPPPSACLVFQPELRLPSLCLRLSGRAAPALPSCRNVFICRALLGHSVFLSHCNS